jgi:hypothetical protein
MPAERAFHAQRDLEARDNRVEHGGARSAAHTIGVATDDAGAAAMPVISAASIGLVDSARPGIEARKRERTGPSATSANSTGVLRALRVASCNVANTSGRTAARCASRNA